MFQDFRQSLRIQEVTQKQVWENFLMGCQEKTFLDSWNWGEFQKLTGYKIWRLGAYAGEQLIAVAFAVKIKARRGTFFFVPHGPIIHNSRFEILETLLTEIKKIAKEEDCSFVRIAPVFLRSEENVKIFRDLGFRDSPIHMHPEITWELDIAPSEEELLKNMRKTTRYLIRQAEKNKDVEISQNNSIESVKEFNELYQDTVNRHHFTPFSFDYLKNELSAFLPDSQISVFLGKYRGEVVASAMVIFWQKTGFYHQGASSLKYPKIPVSYLLQWEAIKEAKKRGCCTYNFWGIAPEAIENKKHPWYGLTLFKMGFGGNRKEYVKTQDFVLSQEYWLNYAVEKIRKIKRGL